MSTTYIAVVDAWHLASAQQERLLFSSRPFVAASGSDWSLAGSIFEPRMVDPLSMRLDITTAGRTSGAVAPSGGALELANIDSGLDSLRGYSVAGRDVRVYVGEDVGASAIVPGAFRLVFRGTAENVEFSSTRVAIKLRDYRYSLDVQLQDIRYTGGNTAPSGLEGLEYLKGKPKPVAHGTARNVEPVLVNPSKLIYQVADGLVDDIAMVYDSGVPLLPPGELTAQATPTGANNFVRDIAWSESEQQFMALTQAGSVATSSDGVTWSSFSAVASGTFALGYCVIYDEDNGLWIVAGGNGVSTPLLYTSPDGSTWTSRDVTAFSGNYIGYVAYHGGEYVAVGQGGYTVRQTDPTGTWTAGARLAGNTGSLGVCAFRGKFYATDVAGEIYESSNYGLTWTQVYTSTNSFTKLRVCNGRMLAVGTGSMVASSDGALWDSYTVPGSTAIYWDVAYGQGFYVGVGTANHIISADGISWRSFDAGHELYYGCAFGPGAGQYGTHVLGGIEATGSSTWRIWSIDPTGGADYASTTELEGDEPLAGQFRSYKDATTGSFFRLGASPVGPVTADVVVEATATDRTHPKIMASILDRAGYALRDNLVTVDLVNAWTSSGTPTSTAIDGPDDVSNSAYRVEDNNGAGQEYLYHAPAWEHGGPKYVEAIIRPVLYSGTFTLRVYDSTNAVERFKMDVTWEDGIPVLDGTNCYGDAAYLRQGWWRIRILSDADVAVEPNETATTRIELHPAGETAANTGSTDIYRIRASDRVLPEELVFSGEFPAFASVHWDDSASGVSLTTGSLDFNGTAGTIVATNGFVRLQAGKRYRITSQVTNRTAGQLDIGMGFGTALTQTLLTFTANESQWLEFDAGDDGTWSLVVQGTSSFDGHVEFIRIQEVADYDPYSWFDMQRLESDVTGEAGFYVREDVTTLEAMNLLCESIGAWMGPDRAGELQIRQLLDPRSVDANNQLVTEDLGSGSPNITLTAATIDSNQRGPFGSLDAYFLNETTASTGHSVLIRLKTDMPNESDHFLTVFLKPVNREGAAILLYGPGGGSDLGQVYFGFDPIEVGDYSDVRDEAVVAEVPGSGGWYQVLLKNNNAGTGTGQAQFYIYVRNGTGSQSIGYTGVVGNGLYIWGPFAGYSYAGPTITDDDIVGRVQSRGISQPAGMIDYGYRVNWAPLQQTAAGMPQDRREELRKKSRIYHAEDVEALRAWPRAVELAVAGLFDSRTDAETEGARQLALRAKLRERFAFSVPHERFPALSLGDPVNLIHPRLGLAAGRPLVVVSYRYRLREGLIDLEAWG